MMNMRLFRLRNPFIQPVCKIRAQILSCFLTRHQQCRRRNEDERHHELFNHPDDAEDERHDISSSNFFAKSFFGRSAFVSISLLLFALNVCSASLFSLSYIHSIKKPKVSDVGSAILLNASEEKKAVLHE